MSADAQVSPGHFHRVGIAADPAGGDVSRWLIQTLGARPIRGGMVQVLGLPFGSGPARSAESGATSDLLWLGGAPFAIFTPDDPAGPLAHYVRRHGPGLHSLAWTVEDLWRTENVLRAGGVRITGTDIEGRHFFMHPGDSAGVLIEWTDTAFARDPRDGAELPAEPVTSSSEPAPIPVRKVAWTTAVVADMSTATDTLSRLMEVSVLTGHPAGPPDHEETVDLAIGDTVVRLVSPRNASSRYADVLAGRAGRLHALCLGVTDLDAAVAAMPAHGVRLLDRDTDRAWTDPSTTAGVPLEWVEL